MKYITDKKGCLICPLSILIFSACSFGPDTETTDFYLKNNLENGVILKSSAVVQYQDGPKTEKREFEISAKELFFLRSLGTTDKFKITEVFKTFDVYSNDIKSSCGWSDNSDWDLSDSAKTKIFTYHVDSTCFQSPTLE